MARVREACERVRAALLAGSVDLAAATELRTVAADAADALQAFAEGTLGCTAAALAELQAAPAFVPFRSLALPPAALEHAPGLLDVVGALSASLAHIHALLAFVQDALARTTSARAASKTAEAVKAARTALAAPVASLIGERAPAPADQQQHQGQEDENKKEDEEDGGCVARLRGYSERLARALAECEQLVADIEGGTARRDALAAFVAQVRPFVALERQLCAVVQQQHIAAPAVAALAPGSTGIARTVRVLQYHLAQSRAHLDAVAAHVAAAPKPLAPELAAALAALVASSEAPSDP